MEKNWTRASDMAGAPSVSMIGGGFSLGGAETKVGRGIRVIADPGSAACAWTRPRRRTGGCRRQGGAAGRGFRLVIQAHRGLSHVCPKRAPAHPRVKRATTVHDV